MTGRAALGFLAFALLVGPVWFKAATNNIADFDLFWLIPEGRLFLLTGELGGEDPFSYTTTLPVWIRHEWLSGALFAWIEQRFGSSGLQVLKYALLAATGSLVYWGARLRGAKTEAVAFVALVASIMIPMAFPAVRSLSFTMLFLAALLVLLEMLRLQQGRRLPLLALSPLFLVWANLHAGFMAGLGIVGFYALAATATDLRAGTNTARPLWIGVFAALLGACVNPYGPAFLVHIVKFTFLPKDDVSEWLSALGALADPGRRRVVWMFFGLLPLAALGAALGRQRGEVAPLIVLAALAWLGFSHNRHIMLFTLAAMVNAPLWLDALKDRIRPPWGRRALAAALAATALVFWLDVPAFVAKQLRTGSPLKLVAPARDQLPDQTLPYFPVGAVNHMRANGLSGNILTHLHWGGYIIYTLWPGSKTAVDGRNESVYPLEAKRRWHAFMRGEPAAADYLTAYPHDFIILNPESPARPLVAADGRFTILHQDSGTVLYGK